MTAPGDHGDPSSQSGEQRLIPLNVLTILHEIETKLEALSLKGDASEIDLRGFPFLFGEYDVLKDFLGQGEVTATVEALGTTRVRETRLAGVWWISHENEQQEVVGENLEITRHPVLLTTHTDDVQDGLNDLRTNLTILKPMA